MRRCVKIKGFVVRGHRSALKLFRRDPGHLVIVVSSSGRVECWALEKWTNAKLRLGSWARIDVLALIQYGVNISGLSETMVKQTAARLLKGEIKNGI